MKTKAILILAAGMIALYSCNSTNYTESDRLQAMNKLNNYVDSVETAVDLLPTHDWDKIENRYEVLEDSAELVYNELKIEDEMLILTEARFELIVAEGKKEEANFRETAEMHLKNVENWWNKTKGNVVDATKNTSEDIDEAAKQSRAWLEANFDKLKEETREQYGKLKSEFEGS